MSQKHDLACPQIPVSDCPKTNLLWDVKGKFSMSSDLVLVACSSAEMVHDCEHVGFVGQMTRCQ